MKQLKVFLSLPTCVVLEDNKKFYVKALGCEIGQGRKLGSGG